MHNRNRHEQVILESSDGETIAFQLFVAGNLAPEIFDPELDAFVRLDGFPWHVLIVVFVVERQGNDQPAELRRSVDKRLQASVQAVKRFSWLELSGSSKRRMRRE